MLVYSPVFMMLLLVVASLVGISSIYKPTNVETQPQTQPQKPPTLSGDFKFKQGPLTQKELQTQGDKQLLDRLMPQIIKRITVKLVLTQRPGQIGILESTLDPSSHAVEAKARCQPGETAISVSFGAYGSDRSVYYVKRDNPNDRNSDRPAVTSDPNAWTIRSSYDGDGELRTYADCLKVELGLNDVPQPQPVQSLVGPAPQPQKPSQSQPPAQPPGGPPLQPPPEFGRK